MYSIFRLRFVSNLSIPFCMHTGACLEARAPNSFHQVIEIRCTIKHSSIASLSKQQTLN